MNERELVEAFITRREYQHQLERIYRRISILMTSQADITAIVDSVAQVEADLAASQATLQSELDALSQANPSLDLSGVQAAVASLDDHAKALNDLKPDVVPPEIANPTTVVSAPGGEPTATGPQTPADGSSDPVSSDPVQAPVSDPQPADAPVVDPASSDPAQPGNNPENA